MKAKEVCDVMGKKSNNGARGNIREMSLLPHSQVRGFIVAYSFKVNFST